MTTTIEVRIGDGQTKPKLERSNGGWVVVCELSGHVKYTRAVWVRSWNPAELTHPKDGKGFLVGQTRKLTVG